MYFIPFWVIHLPMKMEPIVSSETSAIRTQTPGNYPKRNKWLLASLCPSVRMEQPGSHLAAFREIWYLKIFRKSVQKIKVSLKSDKNNLYFTSIAIYRVIKKDGLNWTVNGASTHARQLVALFKVLCSLYLLTCVGYAQNSLEFVSSSPLIHVVGRSFCLYTDSLFAQTGDSNDKCCSSLEVECWNEDETHAAQQSPTQF